MILQLSSVVHRRLTGLSLQLEAGIHVVVGTVGDGTLELLELCAGDVAPKHGSVRVDGQDPHSTPAVRRWLGCAFGAPHVEESRVCDAISHRLFVHGARATAREALDRVGARPLLDRHPESLSPHEQHLLALAVALSVDSPRALLLHEPLRAAGELAESELLTLLRERAREALVLCTTASTRTAALLSPEALLLEDGRLKRGTLAATAPAFAPGSAARVRVEGEQVGELVQVLGSQAPVTGLIWHRDSSALTVEGPEVEALCLTILRIATERGIRVSGMTQVLPDPGEIRATHAALARAAYERAYGSVALLPGRSA